MSVTVSKLPNGMRAVSHAMPHLETVALGVWVGVGARFERLHEHGISHLLEHMAFKGTARRSARDIAEEIEAVGGELNAATSLETTAYYARVLKGDVALALDIIADILRNPRFDPTELARERNVILQEIAAAQDSPEDIAYDLAQEAAFPDHPLGRPILGTAESVRAIGARELTSYLRAHYHSEGLVLAAAGAIDHGALVRLAEAAFGSIERRPAETPDPARYVGGLRWRDLPFEQSHLVLGVRGPSFTEDDFYAAQVLSSLFGGGMSSRLFQEAREMRGLCYAIYSFCWSISDTGLFGVHAATGPEQMPALLDVISSQFERVAGERPESNEVARARAQLKAGLLMSLESPGSRAEQLARQMFAFGRPLEVAELVARVEAIDAEMVRAVAERLLADSRLSIAEAGPRPPVDAIEKMAGRFGAPAFQAAE